jgi:hypothetical protein
MTKRRSRSGPERSTPGGKERLPPFHARFTRQIVTKWVTEELTNHEAAAGSEGVLAQRLSLFERAWDWPFD